MAASKPPPRTPKPEWAKAFKTRREKVVGSQEELAIQADVSQSLISQIERGVQHPTGVSVERFARLLTALQWTTEQFSEATGIEISVPGPRPLTHAERRGWVLPEEEEPDIPEALQIAAQKYGHGDNAPLAERRWLLELADLDFREEPETPEDWLAIYSRLSKLINPKGNNQDN